MSNPGLVVKLRPTGPWRIGPDSGARNRVDVVYHSDSLYSAITSAMVRLGMLDAWLDATARGAAPVVRFGSCFPFLDEIGFVVPPRTIWPPTSPALMSARVRWKSARFVPLGVVQSILSGRRLDDNHWAIDGPSECLVPAGRSGPFRTGVRWCAAVDRLTGATERHSMACIEFRPGAGLWTVVSFTGPEERGRWIDPIKTAFRLLADSGFGGERSRGWGRSEMPEFIEGDLPDMIVGAMPAETVAEPGAPTPTPAPEAPALSAVEPASEEVAAEPAPAPEAPAEPVIEPAGELDGTNLIPTAEAAPAEPATTAPAAAAESAGTNPIPAAEASPVPPPETVPEAVAENAGTNPIPADEASPAPPPEAAPSPAAENDGTNPISSESIESAEVRAPQDIAPLTVEAAFEPSPVPPIEPPPGEPSPVPPIEEPPAENPPPQEPPPDLPKPDPDPVFPQPEPLPQPAFAKPLVAAAEPEPEPEPVRAPAGAGQAHWLLSLFTPAADDTVDWTRGNYTVLSRGGRVDSPAGSGELKKHVQMVSEGSVVYAATPPRGSAADVAPDGFAHPVFRAGFALSIPLPEGN